MRNLVANGMDDAEGSLGMVVADDDDLRDSMGEVLAELGYAPEPHTFCSAAREVLRGHTRFALVLICIGRGQPETMRAVAELLASPALAGADVLLGVTAGERELPSLPLADRAASITFLRMPFDLDDLNYLARERATVAHRVPALRSATAAWDGAVDQRRAAEPHGPRGPRESYAWALVAEPWDALAPASLCEEHVAKAC